MGEDDSPYKTLAGSILLFQKIRPLKFVMLPPVAKKSKDMWSTGNYSTLVAEFTFVRRMMSSVVNTYIPSTLVVIPSWFTFWLDVQAVPGRVTLGVTSFLTLATQVVQTRSQLPPVDYLKALDIWLLACFIMVSFSLLEYAVAYYVFYDYPDNKINKVHSVLHSYVRETEQSVKRDCDSRCSNSSLTKASKTPKIDRISRIGFPVIFSLCFLLVTGFIL
ncbi:glycine receptor subunit alpha-1-like [Tachypleus tridentatus]|uniref:glycine receptor subunit alpha-1-like n=1 Tax=Tachypleus tridentatus TaxID=6853 RepID=UPI003FD1D4B6